MTVLLLPIAQHESRYVSDTEFLKIVTHRVTFFWATLAVPVQIDITTYINNIQ